MTGPLAARISAHPFFAALTDAQLAALSEDALTETFTAGQRLFDEGGIADRFWLIEQGNIALDMRIPGRGDQIVETLGPARCSAGRGCIRPTAGISARWPASPPRR